MTVPSLLLAEFGFEIKSLQVSRREMNRKLVIALLQQRFDWNAIFNEHILRSENKEVASAVPRDLRL